MLNYAQIDVHSQLVYSYIYQSVHMYLVVLVPGDQTAYMPKRHYTVLILLNYFNQIKSNQLRTNRC